MPPLGAWSAISRHSFTNPSGTGRVRSSRLRTDRVVVSSSSGVSGMSGIIAHRDPDAVPGTSRNGHGHRARSAVRRGTRLSYEPARAYTRTGDLSEAVVPWLAHMPMSGLAHQAYVGGLETPMSARLCAARHIICVRYTCSLESELTFLYAFKIPCVSGNSIITVG